MATAFPTEEMMMERGEAIVRIRQDQRDEDARLRREMDLPIWRDWMFWLGVFLLGAQINHHGTVISTPAWPVGMVIMIVALDRVSRRRSRAARELEAAWAESSALFNGRKVRRADGRA